jgi:hypothetical protein
LGLSLAREGEGLVRTSVGLGLSSTPVLALTSARGGGRKEGGGVSAPLSGVADVEVAGLSLAGVGSGLAPPPLFALPLAERERMMVSCLLHCLVLLVLR